MLVRVFSCLIFPHSHTTIMLLGGNIGLVLPVGIVVCRELLSHGFITKHGSTWYIGMAQVPRHRFLTISLSVSMRIHIFHTLCLRYMFAYKFAWGTYEILNEVRFAILLVVFVVVVVQFQSL